ncbi:MAG: hypothetical protein NC307_08045 [Roseburia sp.]|nr:hypothetical protein [Roseburia sp.]
MGGNRARDYWCSEMEAMLASYRQFEMLIPAEKGKGAAHRGEDGRYVESLLKHTLEKFLPGDLEVLNGFILRSGVKSAFSGKARKKDEDRHSSQLDAIIYDTKNYPVYQRFGDTAVVIPEGVVGIISIKKTLREADLDHEIKMLKEAAALCAFKNRKGPFLALVGMDDKVLADPLDSGVRVIDRIQSVFRQEKCISYEEMPGFVGSLTRWSVHKGHKKGSKCATFQVYVHKKGEEHLGLSFLLKGILDVYYSQGRGRGGEPGFISFPPDRSYEGSTKEIGYHVIHSVNRD